jgi:alpha-1,3/alpha-1,6-mannosyltransferase
MYTSHYEPARSFSETRDGTFPVLVYGDWLPRHICGAFFVLFAILRNVYLALMISVFAPHFDVFVVDQVSASVPILRLLRPRAAVIFYLHFPDLLLSERKTATKRLYRVVFDWLEEFSTGFAHDIVVNSGFTRDKFMETFSALARRGRRPAVLYPCIAIGEAPTVEAQPQPQVLLSINRYERKKDIGLAIRAFASLVRTGGATNAHLVIAGGYDPRLAENVEHYEELKALAFNEGLLSQTPQQRESTGGSAACDLSAPAAISSTQPVTRHRKGAQGAGVASELAAGTEPSISEVDRLPPPSTDASRIVLAWPSSSTLSGGRAAAVESYERVTFLRSFSDSEKTALLSAASAVIYTPAHEHFGIVPLECMAVCRPVIAAASGGPLESVRDGVTGFLREPTPAAFADAMATLLSEPARARAMGKAGRTHVIAHFSREAFARQLESVCVAQVTRVREGRSSSFGY